jgi:itaconate CoA-transferase
MTDLKAEESINALGPLAGITVVALEQAVAAPFATRQLADLGARVIKVERPGIGDFARDYDRAVEGQSSHFVWLNRGKESIELDLKDPDDLAIIGALIDGADVFVQNLAPGASDRLGLDADTLRKRDHRLITCSVSGYGTEGPYQDKKAYDLLIQCEAGLLSITGTPDDPVKVGISVADIAAGMYAYAGVLTALYERERTGQGAAIEVSMLEALGEWMSQPAYYFGDAGRLTQRTGARHASIAPYGPYRTATGTLFLGIQNDREWRVLCSQVLQRPELVDDERFRTNPDRVVHDGALTALIEEALTDRTRDEVIALLDLAGIANAVLRTPQEFVDHPQLKARQRWQTVRTPAGAVRAMLPPVTVRGRDTVMRPVPSLGEHSVAIRAELGIDAEPEGPAANSPL